MLRVGAVSYLNARPLIVGLDGADRRLSLVLDLPSRLAAGLAEGWLDVAMVPSIETLRRPEYAVVSDACVACDGPVLSVKLYSRVPPEQIAALALDEGSLTSATLVRIWLAERFGCRPRVEPLLIGAAPDDSPADAVLVIGDRAMIDASHHFPHAWDLGEEWSRWTGLPFVFALWLARPHVDAEAWAEHFAAARDRGALRLEEIARRESPRLGVPEPVCLVDLRDHLRFRLGPREREGLELFRRLAARHRLIPAGAQLVARD